jgi:hypothetical protein
MSRHFVYCYVTINPNERIALSIYFDSDRKKYLLIGAMDAELDEYDTEEGARSALEEIVPARE